MELEDKYENLLIEIHDSEKERLLKSEISLKEKSEEREILEYLIEIELVEFDKQDDAYYLTYEGYEKVEEIKEMVEVGKRMANMEFEHPGNRKRKNNFRLILLGLFLLIGGYFTLSGIKASNSISNGLDEEVLKEVSEEIEIKIDSILNRGFPYFIRYKNN